jgi:glyoxylase-like metal-dependent hydrolase (beta-lactamase superfamily II)
VPPKNSGDRNLVVPPEWWKSLPRKAYSELRKLESSQPWFEVYKVDPEVYVFYEPGQAEEVISYLILGTEKAALIDTGCGIGDVKKLAREFTNLPIMVVNTHSHYDHIAQNYLFSEIAIFDCPYSRHAANKGRTVEQMASLLAEGLLWKPLPPDFDRANYHVPPFEPTRWLRDGDVIDLGHRRLDVFHTPGHSPDSICLLDKDARMFWTGDTFYTGAIYTHLPGGDVDTFIKSYENMISLSACYERLMPSHNEPWIEKTILNEVLDAARDIRAGKGEYVEGLEGAVRIRRYDYSRFAIITNAA